MFGLNQLAALVALNLLVASNVASAQLEKRQDLNGLPACGQNCLLTAFTSSAGGCSQTDFACLCKSRTFLTSTNTCYASCSASDTAASTTWGIKTCATVGVDLTKLMANSSVSDAASKNQTTSGSSNSTSTLNGTSASTTAKSAANVLVSSMGLLAFSGATLIAVIAL